MCYPPVAFVFGSSSRPSCRDHCSWVEGQPGALGIDTSGRGCRLRGEGGPGAGMNYRVRFRDAFEENPLGEDSTLCVYPRSRGCPAGFRVVENEWTQSWVDGWPRRRVSDGGRRIERCARRASRAHRHFLNERWFENSGGSGGDAGPWGGDTLRLMGRGAFFIGAGLSFRVGRRVVLTSGFGPHRILVASLGA